MFPGTRFREESWESLITRLGRRSLLKTTIGLTKEREVEVVESWFAKHGITYAQPMFKGVKFPWRVLLLKTIRWRGNILTASITNLDTSLTDVNRDDFTHSFVFWKTRERGKWWRTESSRDLGRVWCQRQKFLSLITTFLMGKTFPLWVISKEFHCLVA